MNKPATLILGFSVLASLATQVQPLSQDALQGPTIDREMTTPGQERSQRLQEQRVAIHEEMVEVSFDNTGVISRIGSLSKMDEESRPNL